MRQLGDSVSDEAVFIAQARRLVELVDARQPPINPVELAKLQGIRRVVVSRHLDVSGQLVSDGGDLVIVLNGREALPRQRFSCLHEIAHTFVRSRISPGVVVMRAPNCKQVSREEYLCDLAASEMLMPEQFFRSLASDLPPGIEALVLLAKRFGASIEATMVRIGQLAIWPVLFLVWRFQRRFEKTAKLRIAWSVRPAGVRCYVPRHASIDIYSSVYATFSTGNPTFERERLRLGSLSGTYLMENGRFGRQVVSIVHDANLLREA